MKIKKPQSEEYLEIYSARLTFKKEKKEHISDKVYVTIYYGKKKSKKKKDILIPENIDPDELNWMKGKDIALYYRINYYPSKPENYDYIDSRGIAVSTSLCQKLENLVNKVCF
ncbi:MAG TPA: hypothetical protein VMV95_02355 [Bacillota bacterium]|nr:hypothetical protein [Bacillota bacterium]